MEKKHKIKPGENLKGENLKDANLFSGNLTSTNLRNANLIDAPTRNPTYTATRGYSKNKKRSYNL